MNDVEELLRRTFARAEARMPEMPPDLLRQAVESPGRRRRPILVLASVAAATGLVILVMSVLVWRAPEPQPAVSPQPVPAETVTQTPRAQKQKPRTVEKIAPPVEQALASAVAVVPMKVPNGKDFTPKAFLDERTLLGYVAKKGYDPAPEWWSYSLDSRTFKRLAVLDFAVAPVQTPAVGEVMIAWFKIKDENVQILTIPVTGGTPRRVVSFPAERDVDKVNGDTVHGVRLAIGDGKIFWSSLKSGGVHHVPLSGGEPSFVPDTEGLHLVRWPWVGPSDERLRGVRNLLNLSTGERPDDPARAVCDVTWCFTEDQAVRRDGGKAADLPGRHPRRIVGDRFVLLSQVDEQGRKADAVYDIATSRVGRLYVQSRSKPNPTLYVGTDMFHFRRGDTWVVVHN